MPGPRHLWTLPVTVTPCNVPPYLLHTPSTPGYLISSAPKGGACLAACLPARQSRALCAMEIQGDSWMDADEGLALVWDVGTSPITWRSPIRLDRNSIIHTTRASRRYGSPETYEGDIRRRLGHPSCSSAAPCGFRAHVSQPWPSTRLAPRYPCRCRLAKPYHRRIGRYCPRWLRFCTLSSAAGFEGGSPRAKLRNTQSF